MATPSERTVGYQQEPDDHACSEPVGEDGETVICQQPVGDERTLGGGEFPDPDRPPEPPAPGFSERDSG
jgi:hypothetical protein